MLFMFTALIRVSEAGFSDVLLFGVLFSGSFFINVYYTVKHDQLT